MLVFRRLSTTGSRVRSFVRDGELLLRTSGMIVSQSVNMVRHSRGSYIVVPIAVSGSGPTGNYVNPLKLSSISKYVGTMCRSPFYERFLEGCSSPFMRLAEHLTTLRAWCKQCLLVLWKLDVLRPGIVGMRGSMVIRLGPCTN